MPIGSKLQDVVSELRDPRVRQMLFLPLTLPLALRQFLRDRPTLEGERQQLQRALANREQRFLALVCDCVYTNPDSPYKKLLDHAGCELGDIAAALDDSGLEETLRTLARAGVYLMPGEYKGREEVRRGSLSFRIHPKDLAPPARRGSALGIHHTSGSTGGPRRNVSTFDWWRKEALGYASFFEAHDLLSTRLAPYEPMLGSHAGGVIFALLVARLGTPIDRWFARPAPINNWLEGLFYRLTAQEFAWAATCFGPGYARPELVPITELDRIVHWIDECRKTNATPCIRTVASNAVRIAQTAKKMGATLEGCKFVLSGEPISTAKRQAIEKLGGSLTLIWGYWPIGTSGVGCARPAHGDETHVFLHTLAVIEHPEPVVKIGGQEIHPVLFTTLYSCAAQMEINVSNGDQAILSDRDCGCPLQEVGLTLHAHNISSFEKLTSEGLAFSIDELYELLETTLPDRFGGEIGDYQLVEEEGGGGQSRITLLVDPNVGPIDDAALLDFLTAALASGSRNKRFMARVWQEAGTLRVRRQAPIASARGEVLHLRMTANSSN